MSITSSEQSGLHAYPVHECVEADNPMKWEDIQRRCPKRCPNSAVLAGFCFRFRVRTGSFPSIPKVWRGYTPSTETGNPVWPRFLGVFYAAETWHWRAMQNDQTAPNVVLQIGKPHHVWRSDTCTNSHKTRSNPAYATGIRTYSGYPQRKNRPKTRAGRRKLSIERRSKRSEYAPNALDKRFRGLDMVWQRLGRASAEASALACAACRSICKAFCRGLTARIASAFRRFRFVALEERKTDHSIALLSKRCRIVRTMKRRAFICPSDRLKELTLRVPSGTPDVTTVPRTFLRSFRYVT